MGKSLADSLCSHPLDATGGREAGQARTVTVYAFRRRAHTRRRRHVVGRRRRRAVASIGDYPTLLLLLLLLRRLLRLLLRRLLLLLLLMGNRGALWAPGSGRLGERSIEHLLLPLPLLLPLRCDGHLLLLLLMQDKVV
jgi:hypothetical protein